MLDYQSSLLREKFTIKASGTELIALSNRLNCPLHGKSGKLEENFIIRSQNMYDCIRMASKLTQAYAIGGSLIDRAKPLQWDKIWEGANSSYDKEYKTDSWIVVYHDGDVVFDHGDRHPFLDIVEKFSFKNITSPYEDVLTMAKDAFKQSGKDIRVENEANVAFLMNADDKSIRCGTTHRTPSNKFTVSFSTITETKDTDLNKPQFLSAAAAHSEAVQLTFTVGRLTLLLEKGEIDIKSDEGKQLKNAQTRLNMMQSEIQNLEDTYKIRYRPEKTNFKELIEEIKETMAAE